MDGGNPAPPHTDHHDDARSRRCCYSQPPVSYFLDRHILQNVHNAHVVHNLHNVHTNDGDD